MKKVDFFGGGYHIDIYIYIQYISIYRCMYIFDTVLLPPVAVVVVVVVVGVCINIFLPVPLPLTEIAELIVGIR